MDPRQSPPSESADRTDPVDRAEPTGPADRAQPSEDEELFMYLERDQLSVGRRARIPAAVLGPRARAGLWVLRIFCLVVSAMVIYTFIAQL